MRPIRLTLENVHSFRGGPHELDFETLRLAVLSGQNGAGKTTLAYDALLFALFGETRGDANSIISEGEQTARVEFEFALGEQRVLVSRQRSRKGGGSTTLHLEVDGQVLDGKTVRETDERIAGLLHMSSDLLRQTAFSGQGESAAFAKASPRDRKEVLGQILDLGQWERRAEAARTLARDLAARMEALTQQQQQAERTAAEADSIRAQAEETHRQIADQGAVLETQRVALTISQERRAGLERVRDADAQQRKALADLAEERNRVGAEASALEQRRAVIGAAIAGRAALEVEIAEAQGARARADQLEAARQADQALTHEIEVMEARAKAAEAEHHGEVRRLTEAIAAAERQRRAEVQALEREIGAAKEAHAREVIAATKEAGALQAQTDQLEKVPCTSLVDMLASEEAYSNHWRDALLEAEATCKPCPLIAHARAAQAQLPDALAHVAALEAARPWAEAEARLPGLRDGAVATLEAERTRLAALQQTDPAAETAAQRQNLARRRAEIAYDPAAHQESKRAAAGLEDAQRRLAEIGRAEAQLEEIEAQAQAKRQDLQRLEQRLAALREELGEDRNWQGLIADAVAIALEALTAIEGLEDQVAALHSRQGALEEQAARAAAAGAEKERLQEEISVADRRRLLLSWLGDPRKPGAFTASGIPALLVDQAIPDLEAAANDVLGELSDGRMSVALRTQRETREGKMQEALEIIVSDEIGERSYATFSGGEAMRVDLALRIGLSQLLARRAGAQVEMLVLDEVSAPLDAHGRAVFADCLLRLADRFATTLVVTHTEELKDLLPAVIEVSKDEAGSRFEVVQR